MAKTQEPKAKSDLVRLRLDKWLWAARFYKTRSLAKQAIEGGKVQCDGTRAKPSKEIEVGVEVRLRQGLDERTSRGFRAVRAATRCARSAASIHGDRREHQTARDAKRATKKSATPDDQQHEA